MSTVTRVRVLVVDDSSVARRLVSDVVAEDPDLEVVGTAANGRIALARIPLLTPDLVTLDFEMPEMDGLETLAAIRRAHPRLPVVMFSSLTLRGAASALDALALGATDYVAKPTDAESAADARQVVRDQLIPKIKALFRLRPLSSLHFPPPSNLTARLRKGPAEIVVVGVSTGGPNALAEVIPALPADFPVPIVIVQHMPAVFTQLLADRLAARSALPVREAADGQRVGPSQVWIAPGGVHTEVVRDSLGVRLRTHDGPPENSCRPAADVLFRSAAEALGPGVLAVVLTGMGRDGAHGCRAVRAAGGEVLAQDQETSVIWGMPGHVARAGLANDVLPLDRFPAELVRRTRSDRLAPVVG